jgi:hypothetical protein
LTIVTHRIRFAGLSHSFSARFVPNHCCHSFAFYVWVHSSLPPLFVAYLSAFPSNWAIFLVYDLILGLPHLKHYLPDVFN